MVVKVEKELTVYNVEEVISDIKREIDGPEFREEIILDLSDIEDIDTAGLQMLVSLQKYGDSKGCDCRIRITEEIEKMFVTYGANKVLEFEVNDE